MKSVTQHTNKAFTLVELLAVIVLIAIMTGIIVPAYNKISDSSKLESATAELATMFRHARQYAISNGHPVYVVFEHNSAAADIATRKRVFRGYAAYSPVDGFVSQWKTLPEGVVFVNGTGTGHGTGGRNPHGNSTTAIDNILYINTSSTFYENTVKYPDPAGAVGVFYGVKFSPDGALNYTNSSVPGVFLVEGFTNAELSGAITTTRKNTSDGAMMRLSLRLFSGEVLISEFYGGWSM